MYDNRPIGIFDSGVGGLSIYREVKKQLPSESFVYLADQAHNPYGGRPEKEIQRISSNVVSFLLKKKVKLVIVACNTATVSSISYLRAKYKIPLIGVVPVIKTIAKKSKSGRAAVFSTPATAKSRYLSNLIKKFGGKTKIYKVGSSGLEHLVEQGITEGRQINNALKKALTPLLTQDVDALALGCTHYPFLIPAIRKIVGPKIKIYDSGGAIARRTIEVLQNEDLLSQKSGKDRLFTTGDVKKFKSVAEKLLGVKLDHVGKAGI